MPLIGIIRGTDEGYYATGYLIKLIKALNKRFRSKIKFTEIPLGDREKYGYELNHDAIEKILECDCILVGDFASFSNGLDYSVSDIVVALSNDTKTLYLSGMGEWSSVEMSISSYFDGGARLRDGEKTTEGCMETRVCSAYNAMNIVKYISRKCEEGRRRLCFVADEENEFLADMFYKNFENYIMPQSNFHLYKYNLREFCAEVFTRPQAFGMVFSSGTATEAICGIYSGMLQENLASYVVYGRNFPVYHVQSASANISSNGETKSLCSYIVALANLIGEEFGLEKERGSLRRAVENLISENYSPSDGDLFTQLVITELQKKVPVKYAKQRKTKNYLT